MNHSDCETMMRMDPSRCERHISIGCERGMRIDFSDSERGMRMIPLDCMRGIKVGP